MTMMLKKLMAFLDFLLWNLIVAPVKRIIHAARGEYVLDNEKNRQVFAYCNKIMEDPDYEPSSPVEHWMEKEWRERYEHFRASELASGRKSEDEFPPYGPMLRRQIAFSVAKELSEYFTVDAA